MVSRATHHRFQKHNLLFLKSVEAGRNLQEVFSCEVPPTHDLTQRCYAGDEDSGIPCRPTARQQPPLYHLLLQFSMRIVTISKGFKRKATE